LIAILDVRPQNPQSANASNAKNRDLLGIACPEPGFGSYDKAITPPIIAIRAIAWVTVKVSERKKCADDGQSRIGRGYRSYDGDLAVHDRLEVTEIRNRANDARDCGQDTVPKADGQVVAPVPEAQKVHYPVNDDDEKCNAGNPKLRSTQLGKYPVSTPTGTQLLLQERTRVPRT